MTVKLKCLLNLKWPLFLTFYLCFLSFFCVLYHNILQRVSVLSRTYRSGQVKRFLLCYENRALTRKQTSFTVSMQCYFRHHL